MGGIKNKSLSNNKVANLAPLLGELSRAKRVTEGLKYLGICTLTLSLVFVILINLYRTHSSSSAQSNAEPVSNSSTSTLADTELGPTAISISVSSSSSTDSNNPNLSLQIPREGGIAVGGHTVTVSTGSSVIGYELQLGSNDNETALVNNSSNGGNNQDNGSNNTAIIPTTTGTIDSPSVLVDKTYGYTLTDLSNGGAYGNDNSTNDIGADSDYSNNPVVNTAIWRGLQPNAGPATIATVDETDDILTIGQANETTHNIYYGVNIQKQVELLAGDYSRSVVYTAIAELMPEPTIESIGSDKYTIDSIVRVHEIDALNIYVLMGSGRIMVTYDWSDGDEFVREYYSGNQAVNMAISTNNNSTIFTDSGGAVFAFGANDHGQLGIGTTESASTQLPVRVHIDKPVKK